MPFSTTTTSTRLHQTVCTVSYFDRTVMSLHLRISSASQAPPGRTAQGQESSKRQRRGGGETVLREPPPGRGGRAARFLRSGKADETEAPTLIHCDALCEEPHCRVLKRFHNSFDGFQKRRSKKLTSFLILLSRVNKFQLCMFFSYRPPLPGTQRSSL